MLRTLNEALCFVGCAMSLLNINKVLRNDLIWSFYRLRELTFASE